MPEMKQPLLSFVAGTELPDDNPETLAAALDFAIRIAPEAGLTTLDKAGMARTIAYRDLRSRAEARWSDLRSKGLASGQAALLLSDDPYELLESAWACFLGGVAAALVAAPLDFKNDLSGINRLRDAATVLPDAVVILAPGLSAQRAEVERIVAPGRRITALSALAAAAAGADPGPDPSPSSVALLLLTSGSTGLPKVVPLTHRQIILRSVAAALAMADDKPEMALNWMPLDHVGGILMLHLSPLISGCSQVQAPTSYVLAEPARWLDLVDRYRANLIWAPNFAFGLVLERMRRAGPGRAWDLSCVRVIINGGEPVNPATARRFLESLAPYRLESSTMRPMWGMSETASGCILAKGLRDDLVEGAASVGKPIPGLAIRLVDESGVTVPAGTVGVLQVKGPYVIDRYEVSDEAAKAAFVGDGWFSTGDEGLLRDGELVLVGRASETIIVNGANHHAPALEMAVEQLDWVRPGHTAVCAVRTNGADTDEVVVFTCVRDGVEIPEGFSTDVRTLLVRQFGIGSADVVLLEPSQFARTGLGKIQRKRLAKRYEEEALEAGQGKEDDGIVSPLLAPKWRESGRRSLIGAPFLPGSVRCQPGSSDALRKVAESLAGAAAPSDDESNDDHLLVLAAGDMLDAGLCAILAEDSLWLSGLSRSSGNIRVGIVVLGGTQPWRTNAAVAARIAYLRNAASELPRLNVGVIYVDGWSETTAARVRAELADLCDEEIAFVGGIRLVRRLEPVARSEPAAGDRAWVRNGHYVMTGFGEVSRALAGYLVENLDARVTFLARRTPPAGLLPAGCALLIADITSRTAVSTALREAARTAPVAAVLHLAARGKEWPVAKMTQQVLAEVIEPKARGGDVLIEAMSETGVKAPLVLFSSLLATFHAPLYGPYVAANRYLEALAESAPDRVRAVAWGSWAGLGMSRDMPHGRHAHAVGFGTLPLDQACEGLRLALASAEPVVLVGANPTGTRVRPLLGFEPESLDEASAAWVRVKGAGTAGPRSGAAVPPPEAEELNEKERRLAGPIGEIWCDLLDAPSVGLDDNFFAAGGDSLAIAELHTRLCDLTGIELPMVPLFMAANLRDMIRFAADPDAHGEASEGRIAA
jgi:acyl-CoA synthetase (AMP-forming)/AMP-acid ligase II